MVKGSFKRNPFLPQTRGKPKRQDTPPPSRIQARKFMGRTAAENTGISRIFLDIPNGFPHPPARKDAGSDPPPAPVPVTAR
jgi:hypothetical protein